VAALTFGSSVAAQMLDGNADTGRQLFVRFGCYQCHGRVGQGSSAGARLAPAPISLAAFTRYVRQPRGEMPPYTAKVVTDQELADIHAYLRSVPRPPAVASLPFDR
jgi:ubiquinol-cytochrome c reductase cytochrome c subunit